MASKLDDMLLEVTGKAVIYLAPLWIPIGAYVFYRSRPDLVQPYIDAAIPIFQQIVFWTVVSVVSLMVVAIIRHFVIRYQENKRYVYYRIVPHVNTKLDGIVQKVNQLGGYRRPKGVRLFRGREVFHWLIKSDHEGRSFYVGFPLDRKTVILRTFENAYPDAEFHAVEDEEGLLPKKGKAGEMVSEQRGIDKGLPYATYNGRDGIGDLISYMEPGTWISISFSPDSNYSLKKLLRKSERKIRKDKKDADMDSFEKQRLKSLSDRLSGRDSTFRVSIKMISEHDRGEAIIYSLATNLSSIVANENTLVMRRCSNRIHRAPYLNKQSIFFTGRELATLVHLPHPKHPIMEDVPHLEEGQRALRGDEYDLSLSHEDETWRSAIFPPCPIALPSSAQRAASARPPPC
jgi:hypothetical protein